MRKISQPRTSSIFLLELIIAIFIFAMSAAVCMKIFAVARAFSDEALRLDLAVSECSSVAETVYSSDSCEDAINGLMELYPNLVRSNDTAIIELDEITLECSFSTSESMLKCHIISSFDDEEIYGLDVKHYVGKGVLDEK